MTLINRLIKEAKADPTPEFLIIPRHRVRQVAEHARLCHHGHDLSIDEIEQLIVRGEMRFLGIPVRVVGSQVHPSNSL